MSQPGHMSYFILCKICDEAYIGTAEGVSRTAQPNRISHQRLRKMLGLMNKRFDELNGMVIGLGQVLALEERKRDDDRKREEQRLRLEEEHLDKFEHDRRLD